MTVGMTSAIGHERTGKVTILCPSLGIGYVAEDKTGQIFSFSRNFIDPRVFDSLQGDFNIAADASRKAGAGTKVSFYGNGYNAVACMKIVP